MVGCFSIVRCSCSSISREVCCLCRRGQTAGACGLFLLSPVGGPGSITKWFRHYCVTPAIRMFIQPDVVLRWPGSLCRSVLMPVRGAGRLGCSCPCGHSRATVLLMLGCGVGLASPGLHSPLLFLGQAFHRACMGSEYPGIPATTVSVWEGQGRFVSWQATVCWGIRLQPALVQPAGPGALLLEGGCWSPA